MRKFAVLLALCLLGGNAFATCNVYNSESTAQNSIYPYLTSDDNRIYPDIESGSDPYNNPPAMFYSACSGKTTKWYVDTETRQYRKITSCDSCPSDFHLSEAYVTYGGCAVQINLCNTCSYTNYQKYSMQWTTYTGSHCATSEVTYVNMDSIQQFYKVTSCTSCPSGYELTAGPEMTQYCPFTVMTCEKCSTGTYLSKPSGQSFGVCVDCPKGTYSNTSGATSCTPCPDIMGFSSTTSGTGANSATSCCLPNGLTSSDTKGQFNIITPCCATN